MTDTTSHDDPIAGALASRAALPDLDSYLALKERIELLRAQLDAMKPAVVSFLAHQGGRVTHGGYEFCVRSHVTYEYSAAVAAAEERVRELKRLEQENGTATVRTYTEFPLVRPV
jgi:hypothetical protein